MEKDIKLKPKKAKKISFSKLKKLFQDKKKRYLYLALFILPLLIAIGIFGFIVYKEAKTLLSVAKSETPTEISDEFKIESMGYVLRDTATDIQKEYFAQLKEAVDSDQVSEADLAGLVCKNYVADFYTMSNKVGQYDVGGMYYVYSGRNETTKFKPLIYMKARDGYYKYLNQYINQYGAENLPEVESVEVVSSKKLDQKYDMHEATQYVQGSDGVWHWEYDDLKHDAYEVVCSWKYKEGSAVDTSKLADKIYLLVVERQGRFEIVEASANPIDYDLLYSEEDEKEEEADGLDNKEKDENEQSTGNSSGN